ncbi:hypothetical protein K432DRAFT_385326 [Lepidopterella palustris CBS 459.81]|uniref:Uncharacterized protein n=1 Tax=Lepidopterella palustris CBS 459.81 TaxID=1314670 RepID=A0A8E2E3E0_9PEZI|nr:hypothetical protein K432DRAFT_385326 [Lepidopterella palustris CBS 459.81]
MALCREIISMFATAHQQGPIQARALVAASKSVIVPSGNSVDDAGKILSLTMRDNGIAHIRE